MSKIATVICTMSRPADLRRALDSIALCEPGPAEVIVSDDSPATNRETENLCRLYSFVRYEPGPRQGLSANRNSAIQYAKTDWIHFMDDDVTVPVDFYRNAAELMAAESTPRVISGYEWKFSRGADQPPIKILPPHSGFWAHLMPAECGNANCVVINASLFPRKLFEDGATFDEFLRYGCEEIDISRQAIALGYGLTMTENLCVNHFPSTVNRDMYSHIITASSIYAGLKRQWFYEQSLVGTFGFALLAIPRIWIQQVWTGGLRRLPVLAVQTFRGIHAFFSTCALQRAGGKP